MSAGLQGVAKLFRELFAGHGAHVALLDGDGIIQSVNDAWRRFGAANGLAAGYQFERRDYVDICQRASVHQSPLAEEAMVGLLRVLKAGQQSFSMLYPCHAPGEPRWFRMWVQSQKPEVDAVVVAHTYVGRDLADVHEKPQAGRPLLGGRPVLDATGLPINRQPRIDFPWLYMGLFSGFPAG